MKKNKTNRRRIQAIILGAEVVCLAVLCVMLAVVVLKGDKRASAGKGGASVTESDEESSGSKHNIHIGSGKKTIKNPTPEDVDEYWSDSCFFGDSIMYGYGTFLNYTEKGALGSPTVTALVGYDLDMALESVTSASHPIYQNEKHTIFEVAQIEQPERIVLSFGINDLGKYGPDKFVENYNTVITMLKAICPDAEIYVVSTTWVFQGREGGNRTNENIRRMNSMMQDYCEENDCGYIDVASYLSDTDGSLYSGYTQDFYVHINNAAYETWLSVFRRYAYESLSGKEAPEEMFPITRPAAVAKPNYEVIMSWEEEALPESSAPQETEPETQAPANSAATPSSVPPSSSASPAATSSTAAAPTTTTSAGTVSSQPSSAEPPAEEETERTE